MTAAHTEPLLTRRRCLTGLSTLALGLTAGCHSFNLFTQNGDSKTDTPPTAPQGAPCKFTIRQAPYLFFSDFELDQKHPVFRDLANLRDQVNRELQLPPGTAAVQVYLFEDRDHYQTFMDARYPGLPKRRAFFIEIQHIGGAGDLMVYTFWGDQIEQDLRHELTHALLHSVLRSVPLWLDEGLAEYFELPADRQGLNIDHVRKLRSTRLPFKPDLARLETLKEVGQMNPPEYHESWAWVHLMLRSRPELKAVLLDYLRQCRTMPNPPPLGPMLARVIPQPENELLHHLERIDLPRQ